ncbi:MAG: hypothetical protein ACREIA_17145, partial [Opitutaceae bacterium]
MHRKSPTIIGVLLVVSQAGCPVLAQWPHRVETDLLASGESITASAPSVTADGNGGVFAVWNDNRNSATSGEDVFAQYYNANGVAQWPAKGVSIAVAPNRQDRAIAVSAGSGSVYIVWSDERDSANNERIYVQLLNAKGEPQWAANGIRVGPNNFDQTDFAATSDGTGNLLLTWTETSNNFRTFAQKIDKAGALLWGATGFEFSSGVFGGASVHNIVPDGAGGAVLGWIQFGDNPRTVWARRILANGTAAFDAAGFGNDLQALGNSIPMALDGAGGAFLGWEVDNGTNDDLYLQRVEGDGDLPWGAASKQLVDAAGAQDNLYIISDGAGGAYCAWEDPRTAVDNIYVQHVTSAGVFTFQDNGFPAGVAAVQRFSAQLIPDGAGGAIVSFRRNQEGTFAQRFDINGARLWGNEGAQLTDNGTVNFPDLTSDGANGAILGALAFTDGNRAALKRVLGSGKLPTSRLVNISTRAFVGTGEARVISGFVIGGTGSKNLLIRAVGPELLDFGVNEVLVDPVLTLYDNANAPFATHDDWSLEPGAAQIEATAAVVGAFELDPGSKDAAIVSSLPAARFTAGVTGKGDTTGISLVEVYDAGASTDTSSIVNLSSRVFVGVGEAQAIPGFVIEGPATMTLLIRAVGPTLGPLGVNEVLEDPILTLYDGKNVPFISNDNWGDGGATARNAIIAAAAQVGAFELGNNSLDSTLLIT